MFSISTDQIKERAYFLAEARNFTPGYELDDWLQAENHLRDERSQSSALLELAETNSLTVRKSLLAEILSAKKQACLSDDYLITALGVADVNFLYGQRVATISEIVDSCAILGICMDKVLKLKPLSYASRLIWTKRMGQTNQDLPLDDVSISLYIRLEILRELFGDS